MSEPETNQLLREILSVQQQQLECLRQNTRAVEESNAASQESNKAYLATDAFYKEQVCPKPWERAVRVLTLLGVVILLGYVILR